MKHEEIVLEYIAKAMKYAILERKYSVNRLSLESGVSRTIITKILKGENYEMNSIIRVMRILQIHLEISLMSPDNNIHTMAGQSPPSKN